MKPKNFFPGLFTIAVLAGLLAGATAQAADVRQYVLLKGQSFTQTSDVTTSPSGVSNFLFQCFVEPQTNGAVTNMTLTKPGALPVPVPPNNGKFALEQSFSSQAALDVAFPNGTYTLTLQTLNDGTRTPTLALTGDAYPATPHISNFAAAQAVVPPNDFTLTWDAFLGGTVNDYVSLELRDDADHTVVSSPGFGQPGVLNGTSTAFFIKGRTLRPGKVYQGELFIAHSLQAPDETSYPGATGIAAYTKSLKFTVTTTGTPTGPALGQFDLVFNFTQGTFAGTNGTIPFPQPLAYYFALYNIQNDVNYPASVVFTGPGGSGLTNTPSTVNGSSFGDSAFYSSPQVNFSPANLPLGAIYSPTQPSGGSYTVNYKGNNQSFNLLDPRSADQQILVVPTVVLSPTDTVQEIRWTYKTTDGTPVAPPSFMESIEIRVNGSTGGRLYDAGQSDDQRILPATTNHTVTGSVAWTNVSSIQMVFRDTPRNQYVSYWNRAPQPLEITTASLPNATQGTPYTFLLSSAGGTQPVNWSLESGFLPSGLNLMPGTGEISGTPGENGFFPVSLRAMDTATAVTNRTLTLTVQAGSFPAPVFTNASITPGRQLQAQLLTVSNQTYSLETSTNLVHWVLRHTVTATSNLTGILDPDALARFPRLFYRLRIGRVFGSSFNFHFYANGGGFGAGLTPTPGFPVAVNSYSAILETQNAHSNPPPTSVFFTGPGGSGLNNSPGDPQYLDAGPGFAQYQTPFRSSPAIPPGGTWTVNFSGSNIVFSVPDPQAASRLVIPVPTVTVTGGNVTGVSWVYKDAATGATLSGPPAHLTGVKVEIDDRNLGRVYDPDDFPAGTTSVSGITGVVWNNVVTLYMVFNDTLGNHYIVGYSKP